MRTVPGFCWNWAAIRSIAPRSTWVKLAVADGKSIVATLRAPTGFASATTGFRPAGAGGGSGIGATDGGGGGGCGAALAIAVGGSAEGAGVGAGATVGCGGGGGGCVVSATGCSLIVGAVRLDSIGPGCGGSPGLR